MVGRLASCDPCRASKLACDHAKPVCGRCESKAIPCFYRDRPFKRRRMTEPAPPSQPVVPVSPTISASGIISAPGLQQYPNPGYQGSSSHAAIFEQITASRHEGVGAHSSEFSAHPRDRLTNAHGEIDMSRESSLFHAIHDVLDITACVQLIDSWLAKGTNLALAGVVLRVCVDAAQGLLSNQSRSAMEKVALLHRHTQQPLLILPSTDMRRFCSQFCGDSVRWETLGLFLVGLSRAATDHDRFTGLYTTRVERGQFRARVLRFANDCLETALSVDRLSDLQLLLQYEVWIAYATVYGDQSYQSWRKLGDVISALFALGYHEPANFDPDLPSFLKRLRSIAFARAYSGDKNVSIFLGRPPRIHRKYCQIQCVIDNIADTETVTFSSSPSRAPIHCSTNHDFSTETRWTALCALLKERILDLSKEPATDRRAQQARDIATDAANQWQALPEHFQLRGPHVLDDRLAPSHIDFLASARLNHLHVLFLLRLLLSRRASHPDSDLIHISGDILHLVTETVVLKEYLANSGTSVIWRLAYYGLPAAGIICLALLGNSCTSHHHESGLPRAVQDLGVLVAHMDAGALLAVGEANYALLSGAMGTVKSILHRVMWRRQAASEMRPLGPPTADDESWDPWLLHSEGRDFELDFWLHLAEHPELSTESTIFADAT